MELCETFQQAVAFQGRCPTHLLFVAWNTSAYHACGANTEKARICDDCPGHTLMRRIVETEFSLKLPEGDTISMKWNQGMKSPVTGFAGFWTTSRLDTSYIKKLVRSHLPALRDQINRSLAPDQPPLTVRYMLMTPELVEDLGDWSQYL